MNVFTTTKPGRLLFRLPQTIAEGSLEASITGDGRMFGFMFRKRGTEWWDGPTYEDIDLGGCTRRGCKASGLFEMEAAAKSQDGRWPAGVYEMLLIADGAPVEVTLRIKGLKGSVEARPQAVPFEARTFTPRVTTDGDFIHSAGDFTGLADGRPQYGLVGLWALGGPHVATALGDCLYHGDEPDVSEDEAFLPGCPTGDGELSAFPNVNQNDAGLIMLVSDHLCCPRGLGGWIAAGSMVRTFGAVGMWLDY
ncbi:MAG: hypothetical protein ACRDLB_02260 [Actinomycetota bacterium]